MSDKRHTHVLNVDGDTEVTIVSNRKDRFFRFMHWIIDSGILAELSQPAVKAYLVIGRYSDFTKKTCTLSCNRICKEAGIGRTALHEAIKQLVDRGLLSRMSGKSNQSWQANMPNRYRIHLDDPRPQETPSSPDEQGSSRHEQGGPRSEQGLVRQADKPSSPDELSYRDNSLETKDRETATAAAMLEKVGITGKTQKAILALVQDVVQLDIVLRNAEYLAARKKLTSKVGYIRQGLVVGYELLPELAGQDLQAERSRRSAERREQETRTRRQEEQQALMEAKVRRDAVAALPADRFEQLLAEVLPTLSVTIRRAAVKNPRTNPFVELAIYEKIKQEVSG